MDINLSIYNILILFGAIQGLVLCVALWQRPSHYKLPLLFFVLYVFSLAFNNLFYALLDMEVFRYLRALHMMPYPSKWMMGLTAYYYVAFQFWPAEKQHFRKGHLLTFLPAMLMFGVLLYGFVIALTEGSYRIVRVMNNAHIFRVSEVLSLVYGLYFSIRALFLFRKHAPQLTKEKYASNLQWIKTFLLVILGITLFNIFLVWVDLFLHRGRETIDWYYGLWIGYTLLIYWIGYVGFTRPDILCVKFTSNGRVQGLNPKETALLKLQLERAMYQDKLYQQPNLTLAAVSDQIGVTSKLLSRLINETFDQNFSDYVNGFRIKAVKEMLSSTAYQQYTFLAMALEAGFNSKSSFNATFKKATGMTPRQYQQAILSGKIRPER